MSAGISHGESWLLEMGVRHQLPICGLARSDEDLHLWLLCGGHGLSTRELQSTLRRLFDTGDISATIDDTARPPFNPTNEQLEKALSRGTGKGGPYLRYCLTFQGGRRWESLASPNWGRFFDRKGLDDGRTQIVAGSRDRLLELLNKSEDVWGIRIHQAETVFDELPSWEATDWKTLSTGYVATCVLEDTNSPCAFNFSFDYRNQLKHQEKYRSLVEWCSSLLGHPLV